MTRTRLRPPGEVRFGAVARFDAGAERVDALPAPLVWTFDGPFERCLADLDDALRRGLVLVGRASGIALGIDLSLPALQRRLAAGDALQPAWGRFVERLDGYGLPDRARVRHRREDGPLATLVIAYRNR